VLTYIDGLQAVAAWLDLTFIVSFLSERVSTAARGFDQGGEIQSGDQNS
jgi:hypothetical protein